MSARSSAGFTLAEVLVALSILGTALFVLIGAHQSAMRLQLESESALEERQMLESAVSRAEVAVMTGSLGASYFPIKWLGAYYNYSEGFSPNNINQSTSTLAGNYENNPVVAHEEGEGIRFRIWDGRLVGSFGFYQERATSMINSLSTATIDRIWVNLGLPQNQIAGGSTSSYQDTQDYKGRGMELNLTANPSAGLKLIFNYATPTNSPTKINPATKQYVTANLAQWQAYANNSANQFSSQVANDILSLQTAVQTYTDGRELNGTFKYRSNFFGTYTFQEGAWKRFGIGGGANLYGPRLIGNVFNQPFSYIYNSAYQVYNGLLTYSFKWRGHDVKVDLNINNLFDNHDPHFTGTSTYQSVAYRGGFIFLPPRQFVLSTAVSF